MFFLFGKKSTERKRQIGEPVRMRFNWSLGSIVKHFLEGTPGGQVLDFLKTCHDDDVFERWWCGPPYGFRDRLMTRTASFLYSEEARRAEIIATSWNPKHERRFVYDKSISKHSLARTRRTPTQPPFMGTASDKRDKPGRPGRQSPGRVTTVWRVLAQQKNQTTTMRRYYYWRNSSANSVGHVANCTQNYTLPWTKKKNSELIHAELTPSSSRGSLAP